jgi:Family of unknown function (DUF6325)
MSHGPVELRVIVFPDNQFRGEIIPALANLVEREIVRIIDILFVYKTSDGDLSVFEITDLDEEDYQVFDPIVAEVTGFLSESDIDRLAADLPSNSSAAILLFEELWPIRFRNAVEQANGELVLSAAIDPAVIADLDAMQASAG